MVRLVTMKGFFNQNKILTLFKVFNTTKKYPKEKYLIQKIKKFGVKHYQDETVKIYVHFKMYTC